MSRFFLKAFGTIRVGLVLALTLAPVCAPAATIFYQDFNEGGTPATYQTGGSTTDSEFTGIGDNDGGGAGTGYTQSIDSGTLKLEADPVESGAQGFKYWHTGDVALNTFDFQMNINRTNADFDFKPAAALFIGDGSIDSDFDAGSVAANMFLDVTIRSTGVDYTFENGYNTGSTDVELTYGNDVDIRLVMNDGTDSILFTGLDNKVHLVENNKLAMFYNDGGGGWTLGWDNEAGRGYYLGNTPDIRGFRFMEFSENWTGNFDDFNWVDTIDQASNYVWSQNGNGNWNVNGNWVGTHPDGASLIAEFGDNGGTITANPTVTLTANRTVGGILIEEQDYTITGNSLIMDNGASDNAIILIQNSSTATIASNITLNSDVTFHQDSVNTATISGVIANGTAGTGIMKSGTGTLKFTGANTYTGTTFIKEGTLVYGVNDGTAAISLGNTHSSESAELQIDTVGVRITGNITVNSGSSGTKTLGANWGTGWQSSYFDGNVVLNDDVTITANDQNVLWFNDTGNVISGTGGVIINANNVGVIVFKDDNTYSGTTTINDGVLEIWHGDSLGDSGATTTTIVNTTGELKINTATGLTIDNEDFQIAGTGYNNEGAINVAQGTHTISGAIALTANADIRTVGNLTHSGVLSGAFDITSTQAGSLTLSGTASNTLSGTTITEAGTLILNKTAGLNAIAGNASVTGGLMRNDAANQIIDTSDVSVSAGATWDLNDNNETIDMLSGAGNVTLGTGTLTVGADNGSATFSGVLSETGDVSKSGTGTWTVTGTNTFTGGLSVTAGTLKVDSTNTDITINSGNDYLGANGTVTINGGTLAIDAGTAEIKQLDQNFVFGANGGTLQLSALETNDDGYVFGSLTVNSTDINNPGTVVYNTFSNTAGVGNTGWRGNPGRNFHINDGDLLGSEYVKFDFNTGALLAYQEQAFAGGIIFDGQSGGDSAADESTADVGRFVLWSTSGTSAISKGLYFENAVQVLGFISDQTIDGDITFNANSDVSITGRSGSTANSHKTILGSGNNDTITIKNGAQANMDGGLRDDITHSNGVTVNADVVIEAGGTLRFRNTKATNTINTKHLLEGNITAQGSTANEAIFDIQVDIGTSGGELDFDTSSITVNGTGNGGLKVTGTAARVEGYLTNGRMSALTGTGGYITPAGSDADVDITTAHDWADTDVGLRVSDSNAGGTDVHISSGGDNAWALGILIDSGAGLELGDSTNNITLSGIISGTGGTLTKTGTEIVTLSADNTYSGTTTVSNGTLNIQHLDGLGDSGAATSTVVSNGGSVFLATSGTLDNENFTISGDGDSGAGALAMYNPGNSIDVTGTVTLAANSSIFAGTTATLDLQGIISDGGSNFNLTKGGAGTLILSADNTYGGTTTVNNGILEIQHLDALGDTGAATTTTVNTGNTLAIDVAGTIDNENFSIAGTGDSSAGAIDHQSANATTLSGTVTMTADSTIDVSDAGGELTLSGVTSGAFNLTKSGAGTLTTSASNTYTGSTTVSAGTLKIDGGNDRLPTGTDLSVAAGATFDLNARDQEVAGLTGAGTIDNTGASGIDFTVNLTAGTNTFTGNFVDTGSELEIRKEGGGTLVLTGTGHNFSGDLVADGGTLELSGGGDILDTGDLIVGRTSGTATFTITGAGTTMIADDGVEIGNASGATSTMNVLAGANFDSDQQIDVGSASGANGTLLVDNATLTVTGGDQDIEIGFGGATSVGTMTIQNNASVTIGDDLTVGRSGDGTMNILSGADFTGAQLMVAHDTGSTGTFTISGAGSTLTLTDNVEVVQGTGTINLDGGTLTVPRFVDRNQGGSNAIEFNGTTVVATTNATDFIEESGYTAVVQSGGAIFDTAGFNITFDEELLEDGGDPGGGLTKQGTGALTLGGAVANTYTGNTLVSAGELILDKNASGTNAIAGAITVSNGAKLTLAENEQIANTGDLTLSGGTFDTGGFDETLDNLTLTADSVIDMGAGNSVLTFSSIAGLVDGGDNAQYVLSVWNWSGTPVTGGGTDQLIFNSDVLTYTERQQIYFYSDSGTTLWAPGGNLQVFTGEVVPAPEASTWFAAGGLTVLVMLHHRRRRKKTALS